MQKTNNNKKLNLKEKGITLVALVVTIILLLILAGVTIASLTGNQGVIEKAKDSTKVYGKSKIEEQVELLMQEYRIENEEKGTTLGSFLNNKRNEKTIDGYSVNSDGSATITIEDTIVSVGKDLNIVSLVKINDTENKENTPVNYEENNETKKLTKDTKIGTKIGSTIIDGKELDWYLYDTNGSTAYLIATPSFWVPDTTREVNGAWVPKLVSDGDSRTGAMSQAIQKKETAASGNYQYSFDNKKVTYKPSDKSFAYFKSINSKWSAKRENIDFSDLNENEQSACYLADADIFNGMKEQANSSDGNLKGKFLNLVGGPSVEQWENAYKKQGVKNKITTEYGEELPGAPGYLYRVDDKLQNNGWYTKSNMIFGNDVYGAAYTNKHTVAADYPFYSWCWFASPSGRGNSCVCGFIGRQSYLDGNGACDNGRRLTLLATISI